MIISQMDSREKVTEKGPKQSHNKTAQSWRGSCTYILGGLNLSTSP